MANYFGGYDNNGDWVSCFPHLNQEIENNEEFENIFNTADDFLDKISEQLGDFNRINKDWLDRNQIDGITVITADNYRDTIPQCSEIVIFVCEGDWRTRIGFENRLKGNATNFWLQCWDKNRLTIFLTPSWENDSFYDGHEYITSYEKFGKHAVAIFMYDKSNKLVRKYPA
jgi:hypothetical protein